MRYLNNYSFIVEKNVIVYCINELVPVESVMNRTFISLFAGLRKIHGSYQNTGQITLLNLIIVFFFLCLAQLVVFDYLQKLIAFLL